MQAGTLAESTKFEDPVREIGKIGSTVSDAVEESVRSVSQALRRGRHAAEDAIDEVQHSVKQRPLQAVGMAFGAGVLAGSLLSWIRLRRS
jgi:ElaB/YqjD/DUF883 family membrane-anchored ribosome-binding protein